MNKFYLSFLWISIFVSFISNGVNPNFDIKIHQRREKNLADFNRRYSIADSLDNLGNYSEALSEIQKLRSDYPDSSICAFGVLYANLLNRNFKYDSALLVNQKIIDECVKPDRIYSAMHGIAFTYRMTGKLDSSAVWEYNALNFAKEKKDEYGTNLSLQSISILFYLQQNFKESIDRAKELIKNLNEESDLSLAGNMYNLIGVDFRNLGELDSSLYYHERALSLRKKSNNQNRVASSLSNIAAIYLTSKQWEEALPYLLEAKNIKENLKDSANLVTIYTNIGTAYYQHRDYSHARPYYEQALLISESLNFKEAGLEVLRSIVRLDTITGDFKKAFFELSKYQQLYEGFLGESQQKEILDLDKKYELSLKEAEIAKNQLEIAFKGRQVKVVFIAAIVALCIVVILMLLIKKNRRLIQRNELLVREQNHRVKNNLQMISSLLSLQAGKAQDEVSKDALKQSQGRIQAIALLNRSLYDQEEIGDIDLKVYISELVTEVINSITDAEVKYQLDIDDIKLDLEKTTSLGLIINELIVNSVKYVKQSVTKFSLSIKEQSGRFSLEYSDNGENFDLQAYQNSKSFGKKLMELQAKQLRGQSHVSDDSQFKYQLIFA
ncbi:MAG: hypothetical protein COW03_01785 [Cytophagales bacterium CG12_big_fil_rev_8_21_14_0_65_40_12]|nr:MAG: hypothetical protein COW03_01785 [Cytophagales bacterium CG12_big_fil_rev_8_21_14_0_65_40_12]PIW02759.1 MAG: hypothetical protein COW40_18415 [Cytophagales bacterium CG17_big_fil_post_rev_8_21_14_2_50_40_13]